MDPAHGPDGGAPLGWRTIEDVKKCYGDSLEVIAAAHGWAVEGLGNRDGHRRDDSFFGPPEVRAHMLRLLEKKGRLHGKAPKKFGWGGARTKGAEPTAAIWQHPQAASAAAENLRASKKAFFGGWEPGTVFGPAAHFAAGDLEIGPLNT